MPQEDEYQPDESMPAAPPAQGMPLRMGGDGADVEPQAEQQLWRGRPHWKNFAHVIALALGWTLLAAILGLYVQGTTGWVCLAAIGAGCCAAGLRIAAGMLSFDYRLTNQRLFIARGIFSRTIDQTELVRIDDVRIHESFFDRLLGIGSLELLSSDASHNQAMIRGVEQPLQLADLIRHHMRLLRRSSLFVERL
jgi:uncharacterized membrane protein YdbT with pleckstrin-like domain